MDVVKVVIIAILAWLLLGGIGAVPKNWRHKAPPPPTAEEAAAAEAAAAQPKAATPEKASRAKASKNLEVAAPFRRPENSISTIDYLKSKAQSSFEIPKVRVTYYLIARSERCALDSLDACLRDRVRAAKIDPLDFQYTYFLDRTLNSGTGLLNYQGRQFLVRFDKLRENNWGSGKRAPKNNYTCSGFSYKSKEALEFINANLTKKDLFTPLAEVEHPNGLTVSGQPALDWLTLAVNPHDMPMSVPDEKRRAVLTQRSAANGAKAPAPRVFVALEFANGQKFLTEASDGGSGVQKGWVDWRIGNTSTEIRYFQALGSSAKATYFVFNDPQITLEKVLEKSR